YQRSAPRRPRPPRVHSANPLQVRAAQGYRAAPHRTQTPQPAARFDRSLSRDGILYDAQITIDAHHHFWDTRRRHYPWMTEELEAMQPAFEPRDLQAVMSATGVDGTVLVQTVADVDETREFLATAAEHAFIRGVVGWVDLTDPGVSDVLADLRGGQGGSMLVWIRHQVPDEPGRDWLSRADVRGGLRAVAEAGLVYDLLVRTRELPSAIQLVRDMADARFVLDHLAKPPFVSGDLTEWSARFRELAQADNVVAKVS